MKYTVIKAYVDKYTLEEHPVGDEVELAKDRAKELEEYVENKSSKDKKDSK